MLLEGQAHAILSGLGFEQAIPLDGQHVADQLAVLVVVLHEKNQLACHGVTGIVKVNVAPCPTWLFTQILPPCSSTNLRARARPSPVPSCLRA